MRLSFALASLVAVNLVAVAGGCSGSDSTGDVGNNTIKPGDDAGTTPDEDGGTTNDDGGTTTNDAGKLPVDSGAPFVPATHPPYPQIPKNQGTVLSGMKLVTVVASNEDPTVATALFGLSDSMKTGTWFQTVGADYGVQPPASSIHITGAAMTTNPSPSQMIAYINASISGHPEAAPDGNTFYMLYLPEGVWDTDSQGNLGISGSHEIIEAASDPMPGQGYRMPPFSNSTPWNGSAWTYGAGGENGDLCYGTSTYSGGFKLQRIWSNTAAAGQGDPCLPATGEPFYNTSVPQAWYTVSAGGTVQVPITGYSDKPHADWIIQAAVISARVQGFSATITSPTTLTVGGTKYPSINNAKTATMTITAPNAASGSWAIFHIYSERRETSRRSHSVSAVS
jgi:hypothetical protein